MCADSDFAIGDSVRVMTGESGIIVKPAPNTVYDWWVKIHFIDNGTKYETMEPFRNSELTKCEE